METQALRIDLPKFLRDLIGLYYQKVDHQAYKVLDRNPHRCRISMLSSSSGLPSIYNVYSYMKDSTGAMCY